MKFNQTTSGDKYDFVRKVIRVVHNDLTVCNTGHVTTSWVHGLQGDDTILVYHADGVPKSIHGDDVNSLFTPSTP